MGQFFCELENPILQMLATAMCNLKKKKKEYAFVKSLVVQLAKFFLLEKSVLLMDG